MTDPLTFKMSLDVDLLDPSRVLEAAAIELVRRHHSSTIDAARAHLAGDVGKALTVLVDLHDLTAVGAVVVRIQATAAASAPALLPGPAARALPAPDPTS
ncbi:hypothetical protein [Methylobacterium platani]|uniref:Uncharacterized protein n=2 Tax=Methylobacterium platani TaxID=427683 RepID=A0A179SE06_9HYPH|nr:hypothetical protein [Methylobacterium platani]KMO21354.1 hypothetical protein SQ03_03700 [Methylobacterium platani JCM 14648]OAS25107.1 hypothetical protein A5481_11485 [Methylobacterium platani]